jgi:hypothetical protein
LLKLKQDIEICITYNSGKFHKRNRRKNNIASEIWLFLGY